MNKKTIVLKGIGVSPGVVTGRAYLFDRLDAQISFYKLEKASLITKEIRRFREALRASERQLKEIKSRLTEAAGLEPIYIMDVHIMILKDRSFVANVVQRIREMSVNAEWAVRLTIDKYRDIFEKMEDEYLRDRFNDIRYVGQMILRNLAGRRQEKIAPLGEGVIVIASDLSPADTAQMMIEKVLGFATDVGSRTSHTAIVARSIAIPAVVGLEKVTRQVRTNDLIIIDGAAGLVIVNPEPELLHRYEEKKHHYHTIREEALKYARHPAITRDAYRVQIGGNIEFIEEIPSAVTHGAEGIGLYRTEFIYINREDLPTEEDHFSNYRRVVGVEGLEWATIRTFDLGGDKFFSDPKLAKEMNPQMGLRAIRFCLKETELFKVQLRAILRASAFGKTRILFPMISGVEEIRAAKKILGEVREDLERQGIAVGKDVETGAMIEVPSAVIIAEELAREVDFFSIGTNDLIQYVLAIDRINDRVNYLYEPLHPAVLRMIRKVVEIGHRAGIPVAMCGEMAGDPAYTMILLAMEIDELSMNPLAIPKVKEIIRATTLKESRQLMKKVMTMSSASEIREVVEQTMREKFSNLLAGNGS
ncbi:MAG TPA: phosphoenolpyruvate--protein phosphotransferase [Syntrophales bacterium]|nr:phosphoenolpyruvate--protein phosphotransferase [Syntrophales bacterium]HON22800.1 phosphoenolpyruvate--protein phosphotransferase [Syntrophales bacterium]HPC32084.1 phosphoenolpyruvate--protein phosphotransferase [Syntrophales bacterium]HQG33749.1 phosphoenolpyruvate--protein phosphotransferase [Syntrophales bacterium]HQI35662.1 phosphoenolpyruvate--protein phosphotransferase [Syntrophales bacterium]